MGELARGIDFDRAEYGASQPSATPCANCKRPIEDQYWTFRSSAVCGACRSGIEATVAKATSAASLGRAAVRGGAVALACGAGYGVFVGVTHLQLALVTIAIAFVVAKVVRKASGGIGGRRFQVLAVALTYLASVMGYMPPIVKQMSEHRHAAHATSPSDDGDAVSQGAPDAPPTSQGVLRRAVVLAMGVSILIGLALAAPFLELTEAPLGLLIVAFGLWEAWKLTKEVPVVFDGPYRIAPAVGAAPPP